MTRIPPARRDGDGDGGGVVREDAGEMDELSRARRLRDIRRRVEDGTYRIDYDTLADRVIDVLAEPAAEDDED